MSDSSDSGQLSVPSDTDSADEFDGAQARAVTTLRSALAELHTLGDPAGATGTQLDDECQELLSRIQEVVQLLAGGGAATSVNWAADELEQLEVDFSNGRVFAPQPGSDEEAEDNVTSADTGRGLLRAGDVSRLTEMAVRCVRLCRGAIVAGGLRFKRNIHGGETAADFRERVVADGAGAGRRTMARLGL